MTSIIASWHRPHPSPAPPTRTSSPPRRRRRPALRCAPGRRPASRSQRRRRRTGATAASPRSCRTRCARRRSGEAVTDAKRRRRTPRMDRRGRTSGYRTPAGTGHQRARQREGKVEQQPDLHCGKRSRIRAGELQPHEREKAGGRGPAAQPVRVAAGWRSAGRREQAVHRAHRRHRPPHRPDGQRHRGQADPQQHVEHARYGVVAVLRPVSAHAAPISA